METTSSCTECLICEMKSLDLFGSLNEEEKQKINQLARPTWYEKNDSLFMQGDEITRIFLVRSGSIRLFKYTEDGKEITLDICRENDLIGEMNLFADMAQVVNAVALEKSLVCECDRDDFLQLLAFPQISYKLIQALILKLNSNMDEMYSVLAEDVKSRVMQKLRFIAEHNGEKEDDYYRLRVKLTHEEIASLVNVSRVMVTRCINELRAEGELKLEDRHYVLKSAVL